MACAKSSNAMKTRSDNIYKLHAGHRLHCSVIKYGVFLSLGYAFCISKNTEQWFTDNKFIFVYD